VSRWRLVLEARDTLLAVIVPVLPLRQFLRRGRALAHALRVIRPARPLQLSRAARILAPR
jgi:hypothetical protein